MIEEITPWELATQYRVRLWTVWNLISKLPREHRGQFYDIPGEHLDDKVIDRLLEAHHKLGEVPHPYAGA